MRSVILVIGEGEDSQLRLVIETLKARATPFVFVDVMDPKDFSISLNSTRPPSICFDGEAIRILAVWSRLKMQISLGDSLERSDAFLRESEWMSFASGVSFLFEENSVHPIWGSKPYNKISQLEIARRVGFRIPDTMIFIGKKAAQEFLSQHVDVVVKAIYTPRVLHPTVPDETDALVTTIVGQSMVDDAKDGEFRVCPVKFQKCILAAEELRVIAIGETFFAYRVVDPDCVQPMVDRRVMRPSYSRVELPEQIGEKLKAYMRASNLEYGAFDLLLDNGDTVFLECNPEGQWHSANEINVREVIETFSDHITTLAQLSDSVGPL